MSSSFALHVRAMTELAPRPTAREASIAMNDMMNYAVANV